MASASFAQEVSDNPVQERYRAATRAAFAAAVTGDFGEAERQLREGGRSTDSKRPPETELTVDLALLGVRLHESGETSAAIGVSERAVAALARIPSARGISKDERIRAHLWVGLLYSRVLHDPSRARAMYAHVLELDPGNGEARDRLAALDLADAITLEKIKEQEQGKIAAEALDREVQP